MKKLIVIIFVFLLIGRSNLLTAGNDWLIKNNEKFIIHYKLGDFNNIEIFESYLIKGIVTVEKYFDKTFQNGFDVFIFPSRKELDEQWSKD